MRWRLRTCPVMMINGEVYGRLTVDDVPGILAKYEFKPMMTEISLNVLDVAENSTGQAQRLSPSLVAVDTADDLLTIIIADDGCG